VKATYIGGGAHRLLGILRDALSDPVLFENGEICLYDLMPERTRTMARLIERTPEFVKSNCRITHGLSLEASLDGADVVGVIFPAGSQKSAMLGDDICAKHGFLTSDNVSPNGAMHGLKAGPILLDIARKMETYCPNAWLVDFVNPVAVFSGMVNNHTKIKALGVCAGYTNHQWDIARLLGQDTQFTHVKVEAAGVNHMSFITRGELDGQDIFKLIDKSLADGWTMPVMQPRWSASSVAMITNSVTQLARIYKELGVLIFSTEGDGMAHLHYDEAVRKSAPGRPPLPLAEIDQIVGQSRASRIEADRIFASHLDQNLDAAFWAEADRMGSDFGIVRDDIFVRIMRGASGIEPVDIVASNLNRGAVAGIDDRTVVEYSQTLYKGTIKPRGTLFIPAVVQGIVSGLAAHQTMLGDAIATQDPRLLAQALLAYPWMPYSAASKAVFRELIVANGDEVSPPLRKAVEYLV